MYNVGDIITDDGVIAARNQHGDPVFVVEWDKYPHLFQPLPWWSDRKVEDMPEYLNCPSRKMFFRVERWHKSYFIIDGRQKMQYGNYIPATREEYEQWKQSKNK
jgi:hypothetical protein